MSGTHEQFIHIGSRTGGVLAQECPVLPIECDSRHDPVALDKRGKLCAYIGKISGIALSLSVLGLAFRPGPGKACLSPEKLYTVIGVAVYFSSLMAVYCGADSVLCRRGEREPKKAGWMVPVLVYGLTVLGFPLLNGALTDSRDEFVGYAALVSLVRVLVLRLFYGAAGIREESRKR